MSHPYNGHREMHVGHRRAKTLMRGGSVTRRANGGSVAADEPETPMCPEPDADDMPVAQGAKTGGRLDKRARGGGIGLANPVRKITPSKRKPHINININNGPRPGLRPPLAIKPMGLPGMAGAGAMPAIRPPGMATGGKIGKMRKGKDAGQGSGVGRLEEYKHMK